MSSPGSLIRRLRRSSLGAKLAALGAAVTAAVVWLAFWGLSVETRKNTQKVFAEQLARDQRTLEHLQERSARDMLVTAALIPRDPAFQYSLKTFQLEANSGGPPVPAYIEEVQRLLRALAVNVEADLLIATDDSGRVFAAAGPDGESVPRGMRLRSSPAVQRVLDPNAPADSGKLAVLHTTAGYAQVAVYPLVQDGFTIGALLLGQRLDSSFVAAARAASDADVLLTAGATPVASNNHVLADPGIATVLRPHAADSIAATVRIGTEDYVVAPLLLGETQDREPVRLWMFEPLTPRVTQLMRPLRADFVAFGTVAVLIAAFGSAFVARGVLGPFKEFVDYMRSGAATEQRHGRFDAEHEAAEVRTLNESFNQLMDSLAVKRRAVDERTAELAAANVVLIDEISERTRIEQALRESEAQLRQSQKLEAIGTLAGGIAHDFNNLITVISGYTQLALMRAEKNSPTADDLRQVIEASDRAANLTHQLLAFSRKQVLQPTVLDVGEIVNGISPMLRRIIGDHIELRIESETPLARVRADRGQLEQVLLNLAINARDAMEGGGTLTIATANVRDDAGRWDPGPGSALGVWLAVRDTGTGMPADVQERIFEPFFTTKEVGKGTGLGLSMVYGIIKQSGGTIVVDSGLGRGTSFTITLPPAESMVGPGASGAGDIELPTGSETVLIVEDDQELRILARRTLEALGYSVRVARNAAEALEIGGAGDIDVLLTDIVMPRTSGPQLVTEFLATRRAPLVIYMSGYADEALVQYVRDPTAVFLRKPFTPAILARTLRDALDGVRPAAGVTDAAD